MLSYFRNKVRPFFYDGHDRTSIVKKNVLLSFLIKGLSILVSFLLVPINIHYLNTTQYGIWLTIFSLASWINTFDIGLSNGLRNNVSTAFALNKHEKAIGYVTTTYLLLFLISLLGFGAFLVAGSFFNWNALLRLSFSTNLDIWPIIILTVAFFFSQLALQPINSILSATQQPFKVSLISFAGQAVTLILMCLLMHYTKSNLLLAVIVTAGSPVFTLLLSSIILFKSSLKSIAPKIKTIDFNIIRNLFSTGGTFFLIQIGALVLYETDNIIITRTLGPAEVTSFNIVFKYFSLLTIAFTIIVTPYWSAFNEAYVKNDLNWIKDSIKKLNKIWIYFTVASVLLLFGANWFFTIWVGKQISIPYSLIISMALYVSVQNWMIIYAYFLNGCGKLKIQLILVIGTGLINIPLSILLIDKLGVAGTTIANILVIFLMSFFLTYQYKLIVNSKATGVWNR